MKKVSVIIPIYNVQQYLEQCIESVLNQDYENIEIVCVNDASTDTSVDIVKKYCKENNNIVLISNEVNQGLSVSRNRGIAYATGEYILFLDSDDWIIPGALRILVSLMEDKQVDGIVFNYEIYKDDGNSIWRQPGACQYPFVEEIYHGMELFCEYIGTQNVLVEAWRYFWRRSFLISNKLQFIPGRIYEDNLFMVEALVKANPLIYYLNKGLYSRRVRENSITQSNVDAKKVISKFRNAMDLYEFLKGYRSNEKISYALIHYINMQWDMFGILKKYIPINEILELTEDYMEQDILSKAYLYIPNKYRYAKVNLKEIDYLSISGVRHILIAGAGKIALDVLIFLHSNKIEVESILVSNTQNTPNELLGISVNSIPYWMDNNGVNIMDTCIIIAVGKTKKCEMRELLIEAGFSHIIECEYLY